MRLSISRSKSTTNFYALKSTFVNGKHSSKIVAKFGSDSDLKAKYPDMEPIDAAKMLLAALNKEQALKPKELLAKFSCSEQIPLNRENSLKIGYLFLQKIFHQLKLNKLCDNISSERKFDFDLSDILAKLIYTRILTPSSKRSSFDIAQSYLEKPNFQLHDIYRALECFAQNSDLIQEWVYKESKNILKRQDKILFYDCTNYFFEIEKASGSKQYGTSKEHRPLPIVQMGLFLDTSGLPLAFSINPGNTNEQKTLKPLTKQIIKDFQMSKFVVCTDAGLSSLENRQFNSFKDRAFITTQSIKKLKSFLKDWALDPNGWRLANCDNLYCLSDIDETDSKEFERTYFKERWIKENGLEQKLIVSYSLKYKRYLEDVRAEQLKRACKKIQIPSSISRKKPNDPLRYVKDYSMTNDGELVEKHLYALDENAILEDAKYDGFYAVCTNLEDNPCEILKINHDRWQIEDAFRILKTDFKARPVYLQNDDRILAHFLTCFLALLIFKIFLQKVKSALPKNSQPISTRQAISKLQEMSLCIIPNEGYIPNYTRTDITDAFHKAFNFRTDFKGITVGDLRKIINYTRKPI